LKDVAIVMDLHELAPVAAGRMPTGHSLAPLADVPFFHAP
jgi:hypothetical protein